MEYNFKSRPTGKSFAIMIQLKSNIEKGSFKESGTTVGGKIVIVNKAL
jgi:hypothetical protein